MYLTPIQEMMSKKQWTRVSAKPSVVTARPASLTRAVGAPSLSAVAPIEYVLFSHIRYSYR